MSTGTNSERITQNNTIISTNNGAIDDFKTAINNLPSRAATQTKSVTITENGTTTVAPDAGYDGLSEVEVDVSVSKPILPQGTNMTFKGSTFSDASVLANIDFSNLASFRGMFENCQRLTTVPNIDTSNATTLYQMFKTCRRLTNIPLFNTGNLSDSGLNYMFDQAGDWIDNDHPNGYLTDESLNNILQMCINTPQQASKTLSILGLDQTLQTRCQSLSNWDAFVTAGWSAS